MTGNRVKYMVALNLSEDSEFGVVSASEIRDKVKAFSDKGASIIDIGAVSTRPGAPEVPLEEEWRRLEPALFGLKAIGGLPEISIDTTSSVIVRRAFGILGPVIVNDISSGQDDPAMLDTVRELSLEYVAMHKRGRPATMDSLCDYSRYATAEYPSGVIPALLDFFSDFSKSAAGIDWILDPGLGFAKTVEQNWEILENLRVFSRFGRPVLVSCSDKRFTRVFPDRNPEAVATLGGASILRVHRL